MTQIYIWHNFLVQNMNYQYWIETTAKPSKNILLDNSNLKFLTRGGCLWIDAPIKQEFDSTTRKVNLYSTQKHLKIFTDQLISLYTYLSQNIVHCRNSIVTVKGIENIYYIYVYLESNILLSQCVANGVIGYNPLLARV